MARLTIAIWLYNHIAMHDLDAQFSALADPHRRAILSHLARSEATVAELQRPLGISQPAVSRHLKLLEEAGLVERSRAAQTRPRRLKPEGFVAARTWLDGLRDLWSDSFDRLDTFLADPTTETSND
ncbi:ArsR/SmtB family transcription factor [Sphingosinicella microcystinivorans]|uniref:ArsR/SmtB family transcription factor n=1 Tax=Sphingosinicella microcystinivorans TaxID=335406 RepID=UPI001FB080D1|nr:metalloregulator ArsR/SmtB family transcription factor [Sphingosinicella microcystinivorans]